MSWRETDGRIVRYSNNNGSYSSSRGRGYARFHLVLVHSRFHSTFSVYRNANIAAHEPLGEWKHEDKGSGSIPPSLEFAMELARGGFHRTGRRAPTATRLLREGSRSGAGLGSSLSSPTPPRSTTYWRPRMPHWRRRQEPVSGMFANLVFSEPLELMFHFVCMGLRLYPSAQSGSSF